jgi:transposase-like protein
MAVRKIKTPECGIDNRNTEWDTEVQAWRCPRCGSYWTTANGADYAPPKETED